MASNRTALSYCGQEVRKYDNDRFLTCLFAPADRRDDLFALYAFNIEIAKTREVVSEPVLGQIRLQWWRESIDGLYEGSIGRHEVLRPLGEAVQRHGLTRARFERLIEAREADLMDEPPASLACLRSYAEVTAAPVQQLALEILGVRTPPAEEAARHAGIAFALSGLLRAVPFHARARRLYLPADRLAHHSVQPGRIFDLKPGPGLPLVIAEVAALAREHLRQARALRAEVPRAALPALLPAALAGGHLDRIARLGHDVFDPRLGRPDPWRHVRLAWYAWRQRY